MAVPELGRLERADPQTVWRHEAHDFTPWLRRHGDHLAEALGIELEFEATETDRHDEFIDWFVDTGVRWRRALEAVDGHSTA